LVLSNNRLKGLNNCLEERVKTLEEELEKSKIDFEKFEKHCKNSSHVCDSLVCENCENLEKKVIILLELWISFQRVNPTLSLGISKLCFWMSWIRF